MLIAKHKIVLIVLASISIIAIIVGVILLQSNSENDESKYKEEVVEYEEVVLDEQTEMLLQGLQEELERLEEELERLEEERERPTEIAAGENGIRTVQYYHGYRVVGNIEIPRTRINYHILERGTHRSLNLAVGVMWPMNAEGILNTPGNVIIMGHNYRNGRFFSNNSRLEIGDSIFITDTRGRRVEYIIYRMFETTPEDTTYITRETRGGTEITLTTCTDDGAMRLIVQARVE